MDKWSGKQEEQVHPAEKTGETTDLVLIQRGERCGHKGKTAGRACPLREWRGESSAEGPGREPGKGQLKAGEKQQLKTTGSNTK